MARANSCSSHRCDENILGKLADGSRSFLWLLDLKFYRKFLSRFERSDRFKQEKILKMI